jgi:hypothetical protein
MVHYHLKISRRNSEISKQLHPQPRLIQNHLRYLNKPCESYCQSLWSTLTILNRVEGLFIGILNYFQLFSIIFIFDEYIFCAYPYIHSICKNYVRIYDRVPDNVFANTNHYHYY